MQPDKPSRRKAARITDECFAAVIRDFLNSDKFRAYAPATQDVWGRELRLAQHPETLGALSIYEIRSALVQAHLDGMAGLPGKQVAARAALKQVEKWALVRDRLPHPITLGTEVVGPQGGHIPWTDQQVSIAEEHARADIARVITMAANTGQRGSDLVKMRWQDIEHYNGRPGINVTQMKTGRQLWIPLTEALQEALETWERRPGYILVRGDGGAWRRMGLTQAWAIEKQTNKKLTDHADLVMHGLRATAVVRLRRAGASLPQIADMVGMSTDMVSHYCRHSIQRENASAAIIHLDQWSGGTKSLKRNG